MTDLVIFGTGGVGRQALQVAVDQNADAATWHIIGFLQSDVSESSAIADELPVLGTERWLLGHDRVAVFVAIGNPVVRFRVVQRLRAQGHSHFASLRHPSAWIGKRSTLGAGSLIYPFVAIDSDVAIGNHVIINKTCTVGHDSTIGDFVTLAPGVNLGGGNVLETGCDLGIGSVTVPGRCVGPWSIVGAGAVVVKDIPPNVTVVGAPAKAIKERPEGWHLQ